MLENVTVTLPLKVFDELRAGQQAHRNLALALAHCFKYTCILHNTPEPPECKNCRRNIDCLDCEVNKNNPYCTEKLTVDIEQLIRTAKEYALYGKDIETDLDTISVERETERTDI